MVDQRIPFSDPHEDTRFASAGETRHAKLWQDTAHRAAPGAPVVVLMPLTDPTLHIEPGAVASAARAFAGERHLGAALAAAGHAPAVVTWSQAWTNDKLNRFTPLLGDLDSLLANFPPALRGVHLVTIGDASLVAFRWLAALDVTAKAAHSVPIVDVKSLSMISPKLKIADRTPRITMRHAPKSCAVIADRNSDWSDAGKITNGLPTTPSFVLASSNSEFSLADSGRVSATDLPEKAVSFSGDWRLSWADWLHRVNLIGETRPQPAA